MKKVIFVALVWVVSAPALAQTNPHDLAKALEREFKGNAFMLRRFPLDNDLKFDSECSPEKAYHSGSWTEADFSVETIDVKGKNIVMTGQRVGFARLDQSGPLVKVIVPELDSVPGSRKIKITIKGPFGTTENEFLEKVKQRIFITDINELGNLAPPWWLPYLRGEVTTKMKNGNQVYVLKEYGEPSEDATATKIEPFARLANGDPIYRVAKGGVSAPKPIKSPDPEYSEVARAAKIQGTMLLSAVVMKTGELDDIKILRPIGMGLDDKAVAAVQTWKFNPAIKDGAPVPVMVDIEVTFKLY